MKRIICVFISMLLCTTLISCSNSEDHTGQAKTPSGSSSMKGRDYKDVTKNFEEKGFVNVNTEKIEDLVTGWITKDGEVEKVSIGGDFEYSSNKWVESDIEVVIYYHAFLENDNENKVNADNNMSSENSKEVTKSSSKKIKMPKNSDDYLGAEWTIDSLTEHLTKLGFTDICTVACDPDDDKYEANIFEMYIETGLFRDDPWSAGEEYAPDAEISVYYNEFPLLTVENCPDLVTVLTSDDMSYMGFADKYDGRYVEFDANVIEHLTYNGGVDHIINVAGGDNTVEDSKGLDIRIGDRTWGNDINKSVEVGDSVKVTGKINKSWCEYFKMLYVETLTLKKR